MGVVGTTLNLKIMLTYTISKKDRNLSGVITLAPTKSISKRALVIKALKSSKFDIKTISEKDADRLIDKSLRKGKIPLDSGEPAKAIRFLRAFFSFFQGEWIITGSDEMYKRPVGDVIKILHNQGFNIKYLERTGFPPLKIIGKGFKGNITRVDASICSQFVNTTLLISNSLPKEDMLELKDNIINSPFIFQTLRLLSYLGVNASWEKDEILTEYEFHDGSEMSVEADWTAASYWYQMVALSKKGELTLKGLNPESVQGDAIIKDIFLSLGVTTQHKPDELVLKKNKPKIKSLQYDFTNNTDLVPTIAVTCVALGIPFQFSGVEILRHKDSDRLMALQSQMALLGAKLTFEKKGDFETMIFDGKVKPPKGKSINFSSFDDHRIAMALAPLTILGYDITIDNPKVITKSYPCYWEDYKKVGFAIEQKIV